MVLADTTAHARRTEPEVDDRYTYLLQPIRDMKKNWNIDIAHELEDFLEELSIIQISFDGGKTTMNFAEAAMLIQGSACVYSRKVDYLYKLNYEVMELIMNRKKTQQGTGAADGGDMDSSGTHHQEQDEFLSLDDKCEPGRNTLLRGDDVTINLSLNDIPRTPKILVKVSNIENHDCTALLNRKGEIIANSSDFKMNTSMIHPSACMLLDASHLSLFHLALQQIQAEAAAAFPENAEVDVANDNDVIMGANGMRIPAPEDILADAAMAVDDDDDDDNNDGAAPGDDDLLILDEVAIETDFGPVDMEEQHQMPGLVDDEHRDDQRSDGRVLRERTDTRPLPSIPAQPVRDFWQTLDPHSDVDCPVKSFVQGKKSRLCIKETKKLIQHPDYVDEWCGESFYSHSLKKPTNRRKVPKLAAFESLFWKHLKQKKLLARRKAMEARQRGVEVAQELQAVDTEGGINNDNNDDDDDDNVDDDRSDECRVDAGGFDDNNEEDLVPAVDFDAAIEEAQQYPPTHRDMNFSLLGNGDVCNIGPQTYEDLVRAYVDSYLTNVQEYALVTDLSKRVSEWEDRIVPKIEQEDEREIFDIHVYGSRILDAFVNKKDVKSFRRVAACTEMYQVSRLFAATLQLANQYNVEISTDGHLAAGMDTMSLKLLSTKRHHEQLEEYRAPSLDVT